MVGWLVFYSAELMVDLSVADLVVQWVVQSAASMAEKTELPKVAVTADCWAGRRAGSKAEYWVDYWAELRAACLAEQWADRWIVC